MYNYTISSITDYSTQEGRKLLWSLGMDSVNYIFLLTYKFCLSETRRVAAVNKAMASNSHLKLSLSKVVMLD